MVLFAQKLERYCEMVATGRILSSKVTIAVDFGEEAGLFKDRRIKNDEGRAVKFNTLVDAMNYMGSENWKLVNAFPVTNSGNSSSVYHFYFKKEYDASELAPAATDTK
jgi:hypothetical protein